MALFSFSPNNSDSFCAVSADNRLSVWSNQKQQQFVAKDHLLSKCTSMAWHNPAQTKSAQAGIIALGMENGSISVWDLQRGIVTRKLGQNSNLSAVTDVVFSADGQILYSSSKDKHIIEWDIESGSEKSRLKADKGGTSHLTLSPTTKCLAAGSLTIRLFDLDTGKCKTKFNGSHSGQISLMSFSSDGKFLVSASSGVRLMNVFNVSGECLFRMVPLGQNPMSVAIGVSLDSISIVACGERGLVESFRFDAKNEQNNQKQSLELTDNTPVLGVTLKDSSPQTHCVVALGSLALPSLRTYQYAPEAQGDLCPFSDGSKDSVVTPEPQLLIEGEHHLLGPSDLASRGAEMTDLLPGAKRPRNADLDLTIAERLEAMASALVPNSSLAKKKKTPKGESLVSVLEQALQSRDDALLEECLGVTDVTVVTATVNRLASKLVLPFLLLLSEKVERSPTRGLSLCVWMRAVLTKHATYLMTIPNLHLKLASLYQILDDRSNIFPKLLSLNGRLELALSQISPQTKTTDEVVPHMCYEEAVDDVLVESDVSNEDDQDSDSD